MLKDLFKKNNSKELKDTLIKNIMDGYVDIKAYKVGEDGSKKMIYHDTGDNTVTDWMRQTIMQLLTGGVLSSKGTNSIETPNQATDENYTKFNNENHTTKVNKDGYCISNNNYQYVNDKDTTLTDYITFDEDTSKHIYSIWPTKVLLGTGKEYTSWETLKAENETINQSWYYEMIDTYGAGDSEEAKKRFNAIVEGTNLLNTYSATVGSQGTYSYDSGNLIKAVTVNDPDGEDLYDTPADLSKRIGVVGAIKTVYLPGGGNLKDADSGTEVDPENVLNPTISSTGRLLRSKYRGVGRPCFVYFDRTLTSTGEYDWGNSTSRVYLNGDTTSKYLNRLTFKIVLPSQRNTEESLGTYYPYNGYTLKQIGLFNDALMESAPGTESAVAEKMPCGTMLAVKNIGTITKSADVEFNLTWTLTI